MKMIRFIYKKNDSLVSGILVVDVPVSNFIPSGLPYYIIQDEQYNEIKDCPMETWEVEGEPDGYGTMGGEEINDNNNQPGKIAESESGGGAEPTGQSIHGDGGQDQRPEMGRDVGGPAGPVEGI
jgi:hypothetical protein